MKYVLIILVFTTTMFAQNNCDCVYDLHRLIDSAGCINQDSYFMQVYDYVKNNKPIHDKNHITIEIQGGLITFAFDENGLIKSVLRTITANKSTYPIFKAECETIAELYEPHLTDQWKKSNRFYKDECVVVMVTHEAKAKRVTTFYIFPKH